MRGATSSRALGLSGLGSAVSVWGEGEYGVAAIGPGPVDQVTGIGQMEHDCAHVLHFHAHTYTHTHTDTHSGGNTYIHIHAHFTQLNKIHFGRICTLEILAGSGENYQDICKW